MEPLILSFPPPRPNSYLPTTLSPTQAQGQPPTPDYRSSTQGVHLYFPPPPQSLNLPTDKPSLASSIDELILDLSARVRVLKRAAIQNARDVYDLERTVQETANVLRRPQSIELVMGDDDKERLVRRRGRRNAINIGLPIALVKRGRLEDGQRGASRKGQGDPPPVPERNPLRVGR